MRNKFNEKLIEAMQRDDQMMAGNDFNNKFIEVEHLDGSKYHVTHSKMENTKVYDLPCILIFAEHNSPQIFVEYDLKRVVLQPFKGKKVVYKLAKDPNRFEDKPVKKFKKAVKKYKKVVKGNPPFSGPYSKTTKKPKSKKK